MAKETMTVHKALAELKILRDRISDKISNAEFVVVNKHSNPKIKGKTLSEVAGKMEADYQSIRTLINRREAIKRAVIKSNALTEVEIGGKKYTVAEAIDMKANGTVYLNDLANQLQTQYAYAARKAEAENGERLDARADEYVKSLYSGSELKNMSDEISKVRDTFIATQTLDIVDPINAAKEAEKIKDEIAAFLADVDSALSVSNALTTITVEYETL